MPLAFVRIERGAPEPILPLALVRSRGVGIPTLGMLFLSGGLFADVAVYATFRARRDRFQRRAAAVWLRR
jgi:hypothetical protein